MKNALRWAGMFALTILALLLVGHPDVAQAAVATKLQLHGLSFALAGSTIGATVPTLVDWAKRLDPSGRIAAIAEMLNQKNEIIQDIPFREGNLPTGHQYTQRTGLPTVYFRLLNQGVPPSKSLTAQVMEQAAIMEARAQVDRDLALLNGNTAEWRASESAPFLEAMAQKFATTLFYGNAGTDPEQFTGLATRFSSLSAGNAGNIIDAGGTGSDNMSIWVVGWGDSIHGIFPKGSQAGLQHEDLGLQDAFDSNGNRFRAYLDWFQWKAGLAMPDWRNIVRVANIDVSNQVARVANADLGAALTKAFTRMQDLKGARIYMNRTAKQYLEIEQREQVKSGGGLTYENVDGRPVTMWRGIPIRTVDALLETEARVT